MLPFLLWLPASKEPRGPREGWPEFRRHDATLSRVQCSMMQPPASSQRPASPYPFVERAPSFAACWSFSGVAFGPPAPHESHEALLNIRIPATYVSDAVGAVVLGTGLDSRGPAGRGSLNLEKPQAWL